MTKKILIVDDEKTVMDFLTGMLSLKGHAVLKASDGEGALDIIQRERPDLVLLDMHLLGLDGLGVLKILRRDYPKIQVIVMTGYDADYKQKVLAIGCDAYFSKPIIIETLKNKIEEFLSVGRPAVHPDLSKPDEDKFIPRAKIVILERRECIAKLLLEFFGHKEYCQGEYQIESGINSTPSKSFFPQIILFDVDCVKVFGELSAGLANSKSKPAEIITFGEPVTDWDELEVMLKRRIINNSALLDENSDSSYRRMFERLNNTLRSACKKYKLYV